MILKISPRYLLPDEEEPGKEVLKFATLKPASAPDSVALSGVEYGRKFLFIELDLVDPNPFQNLVRTQYDNRNVALVTEQLTESFRKGDLSAFVLNVRKHPADSSRFQLVYGHLRLEAARQSGAKVLPAVISEIDDPHMFWQLIEENEQRCPASIISLAFQVRFVVEKFNWSYHELARLYNRSDEMISRLYRLSYAPRPFLEFVNDHEMFAHAISDMVGLRLNPAQQDDILQLLTQPGTTPGVVRKYLKSLPTLTHPPVETSNDAFDSNRKGNEVVEAQYIEYEEGDHLEVKYFRQGERPGLAQREYKPAEGSKSPFPAAAGPFTITGPTLAKQTRPLYPTFIDEEEIFARDSAPFTLMTTQEQALLDRLDAGVRQVEQLSQRENLSDEFKLKLVELIQRFTKI